MTRRPRLLLVDDDAGFRDVAAAALEREGEFAVETAPGVEAAVAAFGPAVDCVVSDYDMDDATGLDLLARLRDRRPGVPFVLYTATDSPALAERAIEAGATDVVRKRGDPAEFAVLANRLRGIVDRAGGRWADAVLDAVADPVFVLDEDLALVRWNEAFEEWRDRPAAGDPVVETLGLADPEGTVAALERVVREGRPVQHDATVVDEDGRERTHEVSLSPADSDGVLHVVGVVREVTGRHEARRRATENERLLAELADSTDDVLWVFDAAFTELLFVNDAYEPVYGGDLETLRDDPRSFLETVHPEDRDRVCAAMDRLADGASVDTEYRVHPPDYDRWVWVEAEPIAVDGEVVRIAGFSRDITGRKVNERALATQNRRLERLASIVSHDLQSPLSVVEGSIDLARETGDEGHLDRAERAAERIGSLAEDILTLARRGDAVGDLAPVTLSAVARRAWDETDTTGARLAVESDGVVEADRQRLRQLFANLFDNAASHGGDDVLVRVGTTHDGFYVADDGAGIDDDVGETVFDPTYTTCDDGTGLGLDIVRAVAEAHGWTVALAESVDGGARFAVTAPVRPLPESA